MRKLLAIGIVMLLSFFSSAQVVTDTVVVHDTVPEPPPPPLRIVNLNPYFTLHVDSTLSYQFEINRRETEDYYWYLKNSPVGLKINKDNGVLGFKADKSFFLSGKLKYDQEYKVLIGVQSLTAQEEKTDTSFTLLFFNTEPIPSRVKPTVSGTMTIAEGESVSFKVQCETGSFPIEDILFSSNIPIENFSLVARCNEEFKWTPQYDFVKESDSGRQKTVVLHFIGANKFKTRDTATVRLIVKDALNYPLAVSEYNLLVKNVQTYLMQLKYTFLQIDRRVKKNKTARTTFDMTSATTALTGTILSSSSSTESQKAGKILPSVGVALVPIKEAAAPSKMIDQNQASIIRTSIKRLEYMLHDNMLIGEKDPDITKKAGKLREELKQIQIQLIEIPVDFAINMTEEELNRYFNSPKVNKKYRLRKN